MSDEKETVTIEVPLEWAKKRLGLPNLIAAPNDSDKVDESCREAVAKYEAERLKPWDDWLKVWKSVEDRQSDLGGYGYGDVGSRCMATAPRMACVLRTILKSGHLASDYDGVITGEALGVLREALPEGVYEAEFGNEET